MKARWFEVILEAPVKIVRMELASDGRVYFTNEANLYRPTEPVATAPGSAQSGKE